MTIDLPDAPNPAALVTVEPTTTADPPTEPQPTTTATPEPTPEAAACQEIELVEQLWTAYREQLGASIEQQTAAIELETAKQNYTAATEKTEVRRQAVKTLLDTFCERLAEIRDPSAAAIIAQVQSMAGDSAEPDSETVATTEKIQMMDYEQWKKIPTQVIIDAGIPGLGDKKADHLIDAFPTIGDLENARTEASRAHKHFSKLLGKGFGEKITDAIENAMSDILKFGDPRKSANDEVVETLTAFVAAVTDEPTAAVEPEPAHKAASTIISQYPPKEAKPADPTESDDAEDATDIDDEPLSEAFNDDEIYENLDDDDGLLPFGDDDDEVIAAEYDELADDLDDQDEETWADAYHKVILADPVETKNGWGDSDRTHSPAWEAGNKAQANWPVNACPHEDSSELEKAKDWVRGWTAAAELNLQL